eukprot:scpid30002/ scgid22444/ 
MEWEQPPSGSWTLSWLCIISVTRYHQSSSVVSLSLFLVSPVLDGCHLLSLDATSSGSADVFTPVSSLFMSLPPAIDPVLCSSFLLSTFWISFAGMNLADIINNPRPYLSYSPAAGPRPQTSSQQIASSLAYSQSV